MKELLKSLELAVYQKNWYAALIMAITIPDIAGHIQNPNTPSQKRYVEWFNKYIKHKYPSTNKVYFGIDGFLLGINQKHKKKKFMFTGEECYAIRCAVLHQGQFNIKDQNVVKPLRLNSNNAIDKIAEYVKFTIDENSSSADTISVQSISEQTILSVNLEKFCFDINDGISKWLTDIETDPTKQKRLTQTMKISTFLTII